MQMIPELLAREYGARVLRVVTIHDYGDGGIHRADLEQGDAWIVRVFAPSRPIDRVEGDAAVLSALETEGIDAERVIGSTVAPDGRGVLVTRLVPGSPAVRTAGTFRALGATLGRMQAIASDEPLVVRRAGSLPCEDLLFARDDLESVVDLVTPGRWGELSRLREAVDATDDCEDLPRGLLHPDCHIGNAIASDGGRVVLCDWDGAGFGPRVAALGVLLSDATLGHAADVAEGYGSFARLEPRELERLAHAVRFRPLALCAREFANSVRRGDQTLPDEVPSWFWTDAEQVADRARTVFER